MLQAQLLKTIGIALVWISLVPSIGCLKMGIMDGCDDGNQKWRKDVKTEGGLHFNTHCTPEEMIQFEEASMVYPLNWCEANEDNLKAGEHRCMKQTITYATNTIPVSGRHRPVWPVYGEYKFVPPQRWIHSLEHGGLVFLYHPCADLTLVEELRSLVTGCLRRHIITPSRRHLTPRRPFALVTWGCYINFGEFTRVRIIDWIQTHAIRKEGLQAAPEYNVWMNGDYHHLLKKKAKLVWDNEDSVLCPQL